jgi:osmoprotectant transport system permease protein
VSEAGPALLSPLVAGRIRVRPHNLVIPCLFAFGFAATIDTGFLTVAKNRLLSGQPVGLFAAADWRFGLGVASLALLLLATAAMPPSPALHRAAGGLAGALLLAVLASAGYGAATIAAGLPHLARVSLGAAFWVLCGAAGLAAIDGLQRARAGPGERIAFACLIAAAVAAMAHAGLFDALSLAREYDTHRGVFAAALLRHILLVATAVGAALLIGMPLGVVAVRRPRWQGPIFAVLNLLQTIPSIALFGLLLVPLAALASASPLLARIGIGGVGPAPAIIALILYALLPVVRNTASGIGGVDPAVVDAARGLGMARHQLFWQVEVPLALPLLFAGLRIVTVQAIGLAVVAALIGAGGLGSFVFAGLGQYATDLVLLGALPAIGLALIADFLLRMASALAMRHLAGREAQGWAAP